MPINPKPEKDDWIYVEMSPRLARECWHMCQGIMKGLGRAERLELKMAIEASRRVEDVNIDWEAVKRTAHKRGCSEADVVYDDKGEIDY